VVRRDGVKYQLHKSRDYGVNLCEGCLEKQREIDRLREEVQLLKARLSQRQRKQQEGVFGSATPSSLNPLKANSKEDQRAKRGGAKKGHPGHGRRACSRAAADEIRQVELNPQCPDCGGQLGAACVRARTVIDIEPVVVKRICYELERRSCPYCQKSFQSQAPGVLPKALLGNQLLSELAGAHYLQGVPLSSLSRRFGLNLGTLIDALHRLGRTFQPALKQLKEEYRQAPVRHADETGWRTDGHNGYSWLFCTEQVSLCLYRQTRSASVVKEVLGEKELGGVLVVDRYNGYNQVKCRIQYCYAHLLREVEDLRDEFNEEAEVQSFAGTVIPLLADAMHLHSKPLSDAQYYRAARKLKRQIERAMKAAARHLGIRRIQDLFVEKAERMYQWAADRRVPADNNRAERELRPTVIARKVSFGSQSEAGARTREVLMSVMQTLRKRAKDPIQDFKQVLDRLALPGSLDLVKVLFPAESG
jgi:transposase